MFKDIPAVMQAMYRLLEGDGTLYAMDGLDRK
jgi:hypothetical protein